MLISLPARLAARVLGVHDDEGTRQRQYVVPGAKFGGGKGHQHLRLDTIASCIALVHLVQFEARASCPRSTRGGGVIMKQ